MATISLPIWVFAAAVGIPGIGLVWIVAVLVQLRRNARLAVSEDLPEDAAFVLKENPSPFRDDLLAQQIDIIFNGLSALIETERIKINAFLRQDFSQASQYPQTPAPASNVINGENEINGTEDEVGNPISQKVAEAMASGQGTDDIGAKLGLSHAEVQLALKLNQAQNASPHRKLEAVA